ncbi:MAG: formate dehydrogenase subunit alpha [Tepidisphaerales bacterium]
MLSITIDGRAYLAAADATLMDVAWRERLPVAALCSSPRLSPYGSCRLCMVAVDGQCGLSAACTTPLRDGMVVHTDTPDIRRIRRTLIELYLSQTGDRGAGELDELAARYDAVAARFRGPRHRTAASSSDESGPYFRFDPSRCVLCARCVRACDEIQGQFVLQLGGRGFDTGIRVDGGLLNRSRCVTCGACVAQCPTGALADKLAPESGQEPVYSPPDTHLVRTTCAYCGVGCQFDAEVAGGHILRMRPDESSPVNAGHACVKGRYAFEYIRSPDRLTRPLIRAGGKGGVLRPATWEEAIALIAGRFRQLLDKHGHDAIGCISSSRGTNEENYLVQKFVRACLGSNHIDNCARVCHSATVAGMQEVFGSGAATNSLADIEMARLLLIVGCNPTEGHPVVGARIKQAVRRGAKLIVIDPRAIELTRWADVHLQLRPGTNVAVLNGLAQVIIAEGLADEQFICQRTENYEAFRDAVAAYTPQRVEEISGVDADSLRRAARMYATSGASMACHGLGVTEQRTGSWGVMALANLAILTGNVGRPGVGINPLRGQNNVQGSCDMGALPNVLPGYQKPDDPAVQARFEQAWARPLPASPGWKLPEMYDAALAGKLHAMWIIGYDVAQSDPNTALVHRALASLDFLVVSDLFLNETAQRADVVLPAAGALEKDGTCTNGERRIQRVRKVVEPPGEARPDWQAVCAVATAMGYPMSYDRPAQIWEEIAALAPSLAGVSYDRLDVCGLQWPVPDRSHAGTAIMHTERFPRGRAKFSAVEYLPPGEQPDADYPFVLITGRVLQHYNVGTMTRRTGLGQLVDRDWLEMHPEDAQTCGLADGQEAEIASRRASVRLTVRLSGRVARGTLFTSFHFPQAAVNTLLSSSSDSLTRCPEYKVLAVRIRPAEVA